MHEKREASREAIHMRHAGARLKAWLVDLAVHGLVFGGLSMFVLGNDLVGGVVAGVIFGTSMASAAAFFNWKSLGRRLFNGAA